MNIRFVSREDIEKVKWDSCVHYANSGNLFGYTWYLDNVAREWDGLVEGDYVSVLPLIKKERRGGIPSLYIPELIPKAGIYSIHILSPTRINTFLEKIPSEYLIKEISFIRKVPVSRAEINFKEEDYELSLRENYEGLSTKYSDELKAGINKVNNEMNISIDSSIKPEVIADFYLKHHPNATELNKHAYLRIMYNLLHRGTGFASSAKDGNGNLLAVNFFAFSHGKIVSLIPTHKGGDSKFALWKLMDLIIQTQSSKPLVLDFNTKMGDTNPTVFNAEKISYTLLKENKVKGWKKWLNKVLSCIKRNLSP